MDLVLDARTAEIESQEAAKQPPKVLPALSDAIYRPQQSSIIGKIVGGTFMTIRIMAAPVAVVCFMIIISRLNVLDNVNFTRKATKISEWSQSVTQKTSPASSATEKQATRAAAVSQKDPSFINAFLMHEGWVIDPFEPALRDKPRRTTLKRGSTPRTLLETLDTSQLKLVGVMLSAKGNKAIVEDASGKGHVIREGTYIGTNAAKVSQILKEMVIIEEKIEDAYGNIRTQKRILKLNKP
jgi:type IV pilus assembly protein PilP